MKGAGGREVECCGADWAAAYANRVRPMMNTYRQKGAARVYWVTLPTPRARRRGSGSAASSTRRSTSRPSRGAARSA